MTADKTNATILTPDLQHLPVGFALEDYSALRFMRDAARQLGVGQALSLIPELGNPKDLFSLIRPVVKELALAA